MSPCTRQMLDQWNPDKEFFVALDSDGSVLDTMEVKHKECFIPLLIDHFRLHRVQQFAREAWEFVALYSRDRGINRFRALVKTIDLLSARLENLQMPHELPDPGPVQQWLDQEPQPSTVALETYAATTGDHMIHTTLQWSLDVDRKVDRHVRGAGPYAGVVASLTRIHAVADAMVLSTAPFDSLEREWTEHGIDVFVRCIAGQDQGSKEKVLSRVTGGRYNGERTLMVGDAPGDLEAARQAGVLFYPVNPGDEEASWSRFDREGLNRFLDGSFAGAYQETVIEEFYRYLPEEAPWNSKSK